MQSLPGRTRQQQSNMLLLTRAGWPVLPGPSPALAGVRAAGRCAALPGL